MATKPATGKVAKASKPRSATAANRTEVAELRRQLDERLTRMYREAREIREQSEETLARMKRLGW